jgi:hypothetical protein
MTGVKPPSHFAIEEDLLSAAFRMGMRTGTWGVSSGAQAPDGIAYPKVYLWVAAAARTAAPSAFHFAFDVAGYRGVAPTGFPWNAEGWRQLELSKYPKGKPSSRVAMVFRNDAWAQSSNSLYHPYDRTASQSHPGWATQLPGLVWTPTHTIVDLLSDLHHLLNSEDYLGV